MTGDNSKVLLRLLDDLEGFDNYIFDSVEMISGWRYASKVQLREEYEPFPPSDVLDFSLHTPCQWIRSNVPNLDPTPIQKVYVIAAKWHRTINPKLLPEQGELVTMCEEARIVIRLAADGVMHELDVADLPGGSRIREILTVLLEEKACDVSRLITTEFIVLRAVGNEADPNSFKHAVAELSKAKYVQTKGGRSGGIWLAPKGRRVAEHINKKPTRTV